VEYNVAVQEPQYRVILQACKYSHQRQLRVRDLRFWKPGQTSTIARPAKYHTTPAADDQRLRGCMMADLGGVADEVESASGHREGFAKGSHIHSGQVQT